MLWGTKLVTCILERTRPGAAPVLDWRVFCKKSVGFKQEVVYEISIRFGAA